MFQDKPIQQVVTESEDLRQKPPQTVYGFHM